MNRRIPNSRMNLLFSSLAWLCVAGPVQAQTFAIDWSSGFVTVWWAPNTPGWTLEETTDFGSAPWTTAPSGTNNPVTLPATADRTFYRLRR